MRRVGRGCAQTTGQEGSHEGGGGIAHQSTACIATGTKVSREDMVKIRGVCVHYDHDCVQKETASDLNVNVKHGTQWPCSWNR